MVYFFFYSWCHPANLGNREVRKRERRQIDLHFCFYQVVSIVHYLKINEYIFGASIHVNIGVYANMSLISLHHSHLRDHKTEQWLIATRCVKLRSRRRRKQITGSFRSKRKTKTASGRHDASLGKLQNQNDGSQCQME